MVDLQERVEDDAPPRRSTNKLAAMLAVAVLVGALLGVAGGLLVPTLLRPGDDSPEAGFVRDMSTHHAQAVEMGMIAYARATDPSVRTLGMDIALTQHGQIGIMQTWLRHWGLGPTSSAPTMAWIPDEQAVLENGLMPGMATPEEMAKLRSAKGKDVDVQFLQLMQRHHLGGIHMAEAVVELSDDEEVTELAQTMINGQRSELAVFTTLIDRVGH